jgi:hypothetical protein
MCIIENTQSNRKIRGFSGNLNRSRTPLFSKHGFSPALKTLIIKAMIIRTNRLVVASTKMLNEPLSIRSVPRQSREAGRESTATLLNKIDRNQLKDLKIEPKSARKYSFSDDRLYEIERFAAPRVRVP